MLSLTTKSNSYLITEISGKKKPNSPQSYASSPSQIPKSIALNMKSSKAQQLSWAEEALIFGRRLSVCIWLRITLRARLRIEIPIRRWFVLMLLSNTHLWKKLSMMNIHLPSWQEFYSGCFHASTRMTRGFLKANSWRLILLPPQIMFCGRIWIIQASKDSGGGLYHGELHFRCGF